MATPTETDAGKTAKNLRANEFSFEHAELVAPEHPSKSLLWVRKAEAYPFNGSHPCREVLPLLPAPHHLHPEDRTTTPMLHPASWAGEVMGGIARWGGFMGLIGGPRGTWPETDTELEQTVSWKPRELRPQAAFPNTKATRYSCLFLPSPCPAMVGGWALSAFHPGPSAEDR